MFHKLMNITKTSNFILSRYFLYKTNRCSVYANSYRFFCKDKNPDCPDDDSRNKKVRDLQKEICPEYTRKTPPLQVCKPTTKSPCPPCPPTKPGSCKYPPDQNAMKQLPKPQCPWDDEEQRRCKRQRTMLLLGLLFAAATLAALYYSTTSTKKETAMKKKEKKFKRPKPICKEPRDSNSLPKHVPYLLIGGGTASFSAFRAIKSLDSTAKVLVLSNECFYPYMRPPLSKEIWFTSNAANNSKLIFKQWNGTERSLFYEPNDFYLAPQHLNTSDNGGVSVALGYTVKKIDVFERKVYLEDDTEISYDKCLVATGAKPKNLDVFKNAVPAIQEKVTLYRDIFDFQELDEVCQDAKSIAIIGGGFLGSELSCALAKKGKQTNTKVYQIFREPGNMGRVLPEYLSEWTTKKVMYEGVKVLSSAEVEDATLNEKQELVLHLNSGVKLCVDHVIVAVGVEPNTQLAETSELEVDPDFGGFLVNAEMEARSHLYVAGDCSCFYDVKLGRRRVEHHDHAVVSGRLAGENMTGASKPYIHQSMFWSDLGPDVGYEAIGIVDSTLPTVGVFAKATDKDSPKGVVTETNESMRSVSEEQAKPIGPESKDKYESSGEDFGKGIIFYLRDDTVVGIVLWNVFNRMQIARQVLKDERKYDDLNEVAKLFNIHEDVHEENPSEEE